MQFTANEIAAAVGGVIEGDGNVRIGGFAKIEEGAPGDLSFLANPKYSHFLYDTKASAVLVHNDFVPERPVATTLIRVADPYATLAHLMRLVDAHLNSHPSGIEPQCFVAEGVDLPGDVYVGAFAYIGSGAKIGKNVKVYPGAYIGHHAVIGDDTVIYPGVKIYHHSQVGCRCIIHAGAVIGADGFGFAPEADGHYTKIPQMGIVKIEDDVEIGANTTVDRATMGCTVVGAGTKLDNLIQVAHNVVIGKNTVVASQAGFAGSSRVGDNCMIGGQVGVAGHIAIGNRVQIGAQSGIPNNVPDGSVLMGYPAVPVRQFARQAAQIKRLGQLFDEVAELKRNNK